MVSIQGIWRDERGQDLVEYGLLVVLIAVTVIAAVTLLGDEVRAVWEAAVSQFP